MADENDLNNLSPIVTEPTPPPVATEPEPVAAPVVDVTPDPAKLKADIEELEKKRKKAEEDAIYWRKQKAEARADYFRGKDHAETTPAPRPMPLGVGPEPNPKDFEDYDKFVVALTDHRVKVARAEWEQDTQRRTQEQAQQERSQSLQVKLQEGYQKYPDFEEVAFDRTATHITPMVVDILADCEHPADLAYYLAKNRVEGVAISRMTPVQAARAIAKIEAKLESAPPPAPSKKPSNAPPPISPLGGGGAAAVQKDPEKMTPREFNEWRRSQGARPY